MPVQAPTINTILSDVRFRGFALFHLAYKWVRMMAMMIATAKKVKMV